MGEQLRLSFDGQQMQQDSEPASTEPSIERQDDDSYALQARLSELIGNPVRLEMHTNRRTMLSSSRLDGTRTIRLHKMFLEAEEEVVDAVAKFVRRRDRTASKVLGTFIEANRGRFQSPARPATLEPRGVHHDLTHLLDAERRHFTEPTDVLITWGQPAPRRRRRRRSMKLGTYSLEERLIRVHPALDQDWIPTYFVAYIVFHELLHHVTPAEVENGRCTFHTRAFVTREKEHPDYARAIAWEKENINRLLRWNPPKRSGT